MIPRSPTAARRSETARSSSRVGVEVRRYERPVDVSVSIPKSNPPSRRNVDRRNDPQTRPTSAASRTKPRACIWTSMFPALWSVRHVCQCQTYDSESQCATGFVKVTSVSLACGITNKSRRFNLKNIVLTSFARPVTVQAGDTERFTVSPVRDHVLS